MVKFKEIETKYKADNIKLSDFIKVAKSLKPKKIVDAEGWDYYFTKRDKFIRFRAGDLNEITQKRQTTKHDNYIREELNMQIIPERTPEKTLEKVSKMWALEGYKFNFKIFKVCKIYYYDCYNLVYYTVLDPSTLETGKFLEIEMCEKYPWPNIQRAWEYLISIELKLRALKIGPKKRVLKSLFQLFKKK